MTNSNRSERWKILWQDPIFRQKQIDSHKGQIPWNKGKTGVYSEEVLESMSLAHTGKKHSTETKVNMRLAHIGRECSQETRNKISLANTGKKCSQKAKDKLRLFNLGKILPQETRDKMSISRMGRIVSDDTVEKIRIALLGKPFSEEHKANVGIANRKKANDPKIIHKIRTARLKQVFPTKDSKPERMMQLALTLQGIRFTKHKPILGQPDIFIEPNICVFVDGDYPHANPEKYDKDFIIWRKPKTVYAADIWARDLYVTHELNQTGYLVIRVWASKIKEDANICAESIIDLIQHVKQEKKV